MTTSRIEFVDQLTEYQVSVLVEPARVHDSSEDALSVFFFMETFSGAVNASAYIPRKQAKKIIKAMKEALDG